MTCGSWNLLARWKWLQVVLADPKLSGADKSIAGRLAEHASKITGHAWAGNERMACDLGISLNTANKSVARLREHNYIIRVSNATSKGRAAVWALNPERLYEYTSVTDKIRPDANKDGGEEKADQNAGTNSREHSYDRTKNAGTILPTNLPTEPTHEPVQVPAPDGAAPPDDSGMQIIGESTRSDNGVGKGQSARQGNGADPLDPEASRRFWRNVGEMEPAVRDSLFRDSLPTDEPKAIAAESNEPGAGLSTFIRRVESRRVARKAN